MGRRRLAKVYLGVYFLRSRVYQAQGRNGRRLLLYEGNGPHKKCAQPASGGRNGVHFV